MARSAPSLAAAVVAAVLLAGALGGAVAQGAPTGGGAPVVGEGKAQQDPALYADEKPGGVSERLGRLATRRIGPILPGALLLFAFSSLFGAINFYNALPDGHHPLRKTWKYLGMWTLTNYAFALTVLMILPEGPALESFSRQLVVYCVAIAALPEVSSNLRLQLGKSKRALDLYRYKIQVSGLIIRRMQRASHEDQSRDRECIANCYADGFDALQGRLVAFVKQMEIAPADQDELLRRLKGVTGADNAALVDVVAARAGVMPLLLDFFRDDIDEFCRSPVAILQDQLHPRLTVSESTRLVQDGITTRGRFVRRTWFGFQRRGLTARTDISDVRLRMLHYTTRRTIGRRRLVQLRLTAVLLLIVTGLVVFLNLHADRLFVTYVPPAGQVVSSGTDSGTPAATR